MAIHESTKKTEEGVKALTTSIDNKLGTLVDHIVAKDNTKMIPVSVLSWIVVFVLVFTFTMFFGIKASEKFFDKVNPVALGQEQ